MRKYTLANTDARKDINLTNFAETIIDAVHEFMPQAEVQVFPDHYTVHPDPERGTAIKIGRKLCTNQTLAKNCVQIPKLFSSVKVSDPKGQDKEDIDGKTKKYVGGHH